MGLDMWLYADCLFRGKRESINPLMESPLERATIMRPIFDGYYDLYDALENAIDGEVRWEDVQAFPNRLRKRLFEEKSEKEIRERLREHCYLFYDFPKIEKKLKGSSPSEPLYSGYVRKKDIIQYEKGLIDDIDYYLDLEKFNSLSPKEKTRYRFYAWDELPSPYLYYRKIVERVNYQFRLFSDAVRMNHWGDVSFQEMEEAYSTIRLIAYVSY